MSGSCKRYVITNPAEDFTLLPTDMVKSQLTLFGMLMFTHIITIRIAIMSALYLQCLCCTYQFPRLIYWKITEYPVSGIGEPYCPRLPAHAHAHAHAPFY